MADNLERLNAVLTEIEAHTLRLARQAKLSGTTPATLMQELSETVMPLLRDYAMLNFREMVAMREYLHTEVEPLLLAAAGETDSMLRPDDAEMITQRLLSYRSMLDGAKDRLVGEEKEKVEAELAEVDKTLARVAEILVEEDDDDDGEEGEGEEGETEEDDEDESPAAVTKQ